MMADDVQCRDMRVRERQDESEIEELDRKRREEKKKFKTIKEREKIGV